MEEVRQAVTLVCGMTVLKTSLGMLLPEGGLKRFARFGFAAVQCAVMARLVLQMAQLLVGVFA